MFESLLIANRGEVACRIIRTARRMGLRTAAVYSDADAGSLHVEMADEAIHIGPSPATESYLRSDRIIAAAKESGAQAIHPGFGFLSENARFARILKEHKIGFIGPSAHHIEIMGDKIQAKKTALELGIPCVPGSPGAVTSEAEAKKIARDIGYPVLIKAAAGGGGRGMKVAETEDKLESALQTASTEAKAAFGDGAVYIERYLGKPRHIEIQVMADEHGNVLHLAERDCSLQRRHQKILEEAPSVALTPEERSRIGEIVRTAVSKIGYRGAGTVEFLYENGEFFFIEMNTRLQVEHPVTELITGMDLVREQIRVAAGLELEVRQEDIKVNGWSIECRINAENPYTFTPSPGKVTEFHAPGGPGVRLDSGLYTGYSIPPYYDSLIGKLIVHGRDRHEAIMRLKRALREMVIGGVETTIPLHLDLLEEPDFISGNYHIRWLESWLAQRNAKA